MFILNLRLLFIRDVYRHYYTFFDRRSFCLISDNISSRKNEVTFWKIKLHTFPYKKCETYCIYSDLCFLGAEIIKMVTNLSQKNYLLPSPDLFWCIYLFSYIYTLYYIISPDLFLFIGLLRFILYTFMISLLFYLFNNSQIYFECFVFLAAMSATYIKNKLLLKLLFEII